MRIKVFHRGLWCCVRTNLLRPRPGQAAGFPTLEQLVERSNLPPEKQLQLYGEILGPRCALPRK
jgi:hypothetical protein